MLVYRIIAEGTVDEQVAASLVSKDRTQNTVLSILKDRRRQYDR